MKNYNYKSADFAKLPFKNRSKFIPAGIGGAIGGLSGVATADKDSNAFDKTIRAVGGAAVGGGIGATAGKFLNKPKVSGNTVKKSTPDVNAAAPSKPFDDMNETEKQAFIQDNIKKSQQQLDQTTAATAGDLSTLKSRTEDFDRQIEAAQKAGDVKKAAQLRDEMFNTLNAASSIDRQSAGGLKRQYQKKWHSDVVGFSEWGENMTNTATQCNFGFGLKGGVIGATVGGGIGVAAGGLKDTDEYGNPLTEEQIKRNKIIGGLSGAVSGGLLGTTVDNVLWAKKDINKSLPYIKEEYRDAWSVNPDTGKPGKKGQAFADDPEIQKAIKDSYNEKVRNTNKEWFAQKAKYEEYKARQRRKDSAKKFTTPETTDEFLTNYDLRMSRLTSNQEVDDAYKSFLTDTAGFTDKYRDNPELMSKYKTINKKFHPDTRRKFSAPKNNYVYFSKIVRYVKPRQFFDDIPVPPPVGEPVIPKSPIDDILDKIKTDKTYGQELNKRVMDNLSEDDKNRIKNHPLVKSTSRYGTGTSIAGAGLLGGLAAGGSYLNYINSEKSQLDEINKIENPQQKQELLKLYNEGKNKRKAGALISGALATGTGVYSGAYLGAIAGSTVGYRKAGGLNKNKETVVSGMDEYTKRVTKEMFKDAGVKFSNKSSPANFGKLLETSLGGAIGLSLGGSILASNHQSKILEMSDEKNLYKKQKEIINYRNDNLKRLPLNVAALGAVTLGGALLGRKFYKFS